MSLFKQAGINRVSLGIQSLQSRHLSFFKRDHTVTEGLKAIEYLVHLFDERVSVDLIWGIPGQTIEEWSQELRTVTSMNIHHLSLYQLTQKKGTLLDKQVEQGLVLPNDELASQFFQSTRETLTDFTQYEVSSFVRTQKMNHQSVHNKAYWTGQDYFGIGPGAHGRYFDPIEQVRKSEYRVFFIELIAVDFGAKCLDDPM
jgi:coproporphyrinogen III oxidase-like Fe-S oxidoreductase